MSTEAGPNTNPLIWTAIEQRRLLRLWYKNRERIVKPHDYGVHNGLIKLFEYQVGGSSCRPTGFLATLARARTDSPGWTRGGPLLSENQPWNIRDCRSRFE